MTTNPPTLAQTAMIIKSSLCDSLGEGVGLVVGEALGGRELLSISTDPLSSTRKLVPVGVV